MESTIYILIILVAMVGLMCFYAATLKRKQAQSVWKANKLQKIWSIDYNRWTLWNSRWSRYRKENNCSWCRWGLLDFELAAIKPYYRQRNNFTRRCNWKNKTGSLSQLKHKEWDEKTSLCSAWNICRSPIAKFVMKSIMNNYKNQKSATSSWTWQSDS